MDGRFGLRHLVKRLRARPTVRRALRRSVRSLQKETALGVVLLYIAFAYFDCGALCNGQN